MTRIVRVLATLGVLALFLAACGQQPPSAASSLLSGESLAPIDPATVGGAFEVTGSSTVYPLTARLVEEFADEGSSAQIDVKVTGTGGGFDSFCNGDPVDLVNASRPIAEDEIAACRRIGREPLGFQIGVDALAVVVSNQNTFVQSLTFTQLASIFSGQARSWRDIDPSYPEQPINVFSPGVDSGTFDYFVAEVLDGDDGAIPAIPGAVLSEDDAELQRGIENNPNAIGYFGYAYYLSDEERLRAVPIARDNTAVLPGTDTVADGSYPLARPLFIYSSTAIIESNPTVAAFISYYLQHVAEVVAEVGYFPVSDGVMAAAQRDLVAALR